MRTRGHSSWTLEKHAWLVGPFLVLPVLVLTIGALITPVRVSADDDDGLVSFWPFNRVVSGFTPDVVDDNPGTLVGGPTLVRGKANKALSFNGTLQYVSFGSPDNLNPPNAFGISVWVKPDDFSDAWGGAGFILSNGRDCCGWSFGGYGLHLTHLQTPRAYFYQPDNSQVEVLGEPMTPEEWHHIVVSFDGTSLRIYQDGKQTGITTFPVTTLKPGLADLVAGAHIPGQSCCDYPFHGEIDQLKIFNRAIEEDEDDDD